MTSTVRIRQRTKRLGIVYGIPILDPDTGVIRIDYVGQTRQKLKARSDQHRTDQPWSDLFVGDAVVLAQGVWDDGDLDAVELHLIGERRPRYNLLGNEGNPARIPKYEARAQRWARDDAAVPPRPRWVPPERRLLAQRGFVPAYVSVSTGRRWWPSRWAPWQQKTALWFAGWVGPFALLWGLLDRHGVPDRWDTGVAAALATALLGVGLRLPYRRKRRRRR